MIALIAVMLTSCKKDPPVCDFTYVATGLSVSFTSTSTNTDTYLWEFGDTQTSTEMNPVHVYIGAGTFNVKLTVTGEGGTDYKRVDVAVVVTAADVKNMLTGGAGAANGKTWVLKTTVTSTDGGSAINQAMTILFPIPADFFTMLGSEKNDGKKDEYTFKYNGSYSIATKNDTSLAITIFATVNGIGIPNTNTPSGTCRIKGYVQPAGATWTLNETNITVNAISPDPMTQTVPPNLANVTITGQKWLSLSAGSFLGFNDFTTSTNLIIKSISPTEMQVAMIVCLYQGAGLAGGIAYANKPNLMFHMTFIPK